MNTYNIEGKTYIVYEGKLYAEVDGAQRPADEPAPTAAKKKGGRPKKPQTGVEPAAKRKYTKRVQLTTEQQTVAEDGWPFTVAQAKNIVSLYKLNLSYKSIAKKFESNAGEIATFIGHLIEEGKLKERNATESADEEEPVNELD
jgi:DNA invertase Pin-like site-specific DNA recombinase